MLIASHSTTTSAGSEQRDKTPKIAFVFGAPRSGTTWLGKLLDSSPAVAYLHEPINKGRDLVLHRVIGALRRGQPIDRGADRAAACELVRSYPSFLQPPFFHKDFCKLPGALPMAWTWKMLTGRPATLLATPRSSQRVGAIVVKDGLCWFSRPLTEALDAKALILLRHPCGVVSSMLRGQQIGAMEEMPRDTFWQSESKLLSRLGYRYEDVQQLQDDEFEALRWLTVYHEVPAWADDARFKVITYHETVVDTPAVVEEIFPWLGLAVTDQTRQFMTAARQPGGDWLRRVMGQKKLYYAVSPRSSRPDLAWREELSGDSIQRVLKIVESFPLERYWPEQTV